MFERLVEPNERSARRRAEDQQTREEECPNLLAAGERAELERPPPEFPGDMALGREVQAAGPEHRLPATLNLFRERLDVALGDRVAACEEGLMCCQRDSFPAIERFQFADALLLLVRRRESVLQLRALCREQRERSVDLLQLLLLGLQPRAGRVEVGLGDVCVGFEWDRQRARLF